MKILIVDSFAQPVDYSKPVQGGLVKSSMMDAEAMSKRHDVHYMYYGFPCYDQGFKPIVIDELSPAQWCLKNKKKVREAHRKITADIPIYINEIAKVSPDALIIHVVSKSKYIRELSKKFYDIPRIYVFHDGVSNNDLFGTIGIIKCWLDIQKYNGFITTNSEYTRDTIYQVLIDREEYARENYPEIMCQIPDVHNINLVDAAFDHFVYYNF